MKELSNASVGMICLTVGFISCKIINTISEKIDKKYEYKMKEIDANDKRKVD